MCVARVMHWTRWFICAFVTHSNNNWIIANVRFNANCTSHSNQIRTFATSSSATVAVAAVLQKNNSKSLASLWHTINQFSSNRKYNYAKQMKVFRQNLSLCMRCIHHILIKGKKIFLFYSFIYFRANAIAFALCACDSLCIENGIEIAFGYRERESSVFFCILQKSTKWYEIKIQWYKKDSRK